MFGRETFIVRVAEDAMAPPVRVRDYVRIDPDERAAHRRLGTVREPGRGGETAFRLFIERDRRRILRAFAERCPERTVDVGNEIGIRGISRQSSSATPPTPDEPRGWVGRARQRPLLHGPIHCTRPIEGAEHWPNSARKHQEKVGRKSNIRAG